MRWYMPSFSGDFRLEPALKNADHSELTLHRPTLGEIEQVRAFLKRARKKGWTDLSDVMINGSDGSPYRGADKQIIPLRASVSEAGAELLKVVRSKKATLTGIKFKDGQVHVTEGNGEQAAAAVAAAEKDDAEVAASVRRPTPSCPQCEEGAVGPASEVLLEFLTPAQHADWAEHRAIVVEGGYTGHRYLLAHRKTKTAAKIGKICYDLDSKAVIHFHDSMVPPEEEVLAAKLILEHREDWLRNEATLMGFYTSGGIAGMDITERFKNPFGDITDGIPDAHFSQFIGGFAAGAGAMLKGRS
jgi:hypothetical protein